LFARLKDLCTPLGCRGLGFCGIDGGCVQMRVADAGNFCAGGLAAGFGSGSFVDFGGRGVSVGGDLSNHIEVEAELDAADIADGGVEGAEDEFGALDFDGAAKQSVDDLHEGDLDGFLVLEEGGVMDTRAWTSDGAEHALVEIAELLSAESGGAAADSRDLDVGAVFRVWHIGPVGPFDIGIHLRNNFFVVTS